MSTYFLIKSYSEGVSKFITRSSLITFRKFVNVMFYKLLESVCNTNSSLTWIYWEHFQRSHLHCQPIPFPPIRSPFFLMNNLPQNVKSLGLVLYFNNLVSFWILRPYSKHVLPKQTSVWYNLIFLRCSFNLISIFLLVCPIYTILQS